MKMIDINTIDGNVIIGAGESSPPKDNRDTYAIKCSAINGSKLLSDVYIHGGFVEVYSLDTIRKNNMELT
jgi:hypothetical protein